MCPGGWGSLGFFMSNCSSGHLLLPVLYRKPTASTIQETRLPVLYRRPAASHNGSYRDPPTPDGGFSGPDEDFPCGQGRVGLQPQVV